MKYATQAKYSKEIGTTRYDTADEAWEAVHPSNRSFFHVVGIREEVVSMTRKLSWVPAEVK